MANYHDRIGELRHEFIPATSYVGEDVPRLERERLWPKVWQVACREEEIPNIGDFVTYEIENDSFLVVRVAADEIRWHCQMDGRPPHRSLTVQHEQAPSSSVEDGTRIRFGEGGSITLVEPIDEVMDRLDQPPTYC